MKKHKAIKLLIAAILTLLCCRCAFLMSQYPFFGIRVEQNQKNQWIVDHFDTAGERLPTDVEIGDIIKMVDGKPASEHGTIKWHGVEQFRTLVVERNGVELDVDARGLPNVGRSDIKALAGAIVSILIALFVWRKTPHTGLTRQLASVFLFITITFICLLGTSRVDSLACISMFALLPGVPVIFLNFLSSFYMEKNLDRISIGFAQKLWAPPILLLFFCVVCIAFPSMFPILLHLAPISILCFTLGVIVNLYIIVKSYLIYRKESSYEATLIKTISASFCISFLPIVMLSLIPQLFNPHYNGIVEPFYTGWFVLFFPASFAYLIVSRQLYDVHLVLRRIMISAAVSLAPSGVMTGLIALLAPQIPGGRLIFVFILMVVVFTFMLYTLEYFTTMLEPIMFPRKHQLSSALKKIAKNLGTISNLRELRETVLVDLVAALQVHGGAIVFRYRETVESIAVGDIDTAEVERLVSHGLDDHPQYYGVEINRNDENTSFLIMTRKKSNTRLGQEERQWLGLITTYLAVTLENIHLIRKMTDKLEHLASRVEDAQDWNWFRKLMFELQEVERTRIATDLHDTTMQDLYFMKRRLAGLLAKSSLCAEDAREIEQLAEFIEIVNMNLRQSCYELHPHLLREVGLIAAVQKLLSLEDAGGQFAIVFEPVHAEQIETISLDAKRHLFRMIQELINNAKKHSHALNVTLKLQAVNGRVELLYADDGVGFEAERSIDQTTALTGVGLEQMKSRILSLNGSVELETGLGSGVKLRFAFPFQTEWSA